MSLLVEIFGYLRVVLGKKEIELEWPGGTLLEMIQHLDDQYSGATSQELLDENGELDRAYIVFLKGERIYGLSTRIEDGDQVVITSMLAGGS